MWPHSGCDVKIAGRAAAIAARALSWDTDSLSCFGAWGNIDPHRFRPNYSTRSAAHRARFVGNLAAAAAAITRHRPLDGQSGLKPLHRVQEIDIHSSFEIFSLAADVAASPSRSEEILKTKAEQ